MQFRNKSRFDKKHHLRLRKIEEGDWVIVYDSSLDHQHTVIQKLTRKWFEPYEVRKAFNRTYQLNELDGAILRLLIAGKRVKIFKKRIDDKLYVILDKPVTKEQSDKDLESVGSEVSELDLIIDIGEEIEGATDEED